MYTQTRINAFQYFFRSQRVNATIKKRQRGFPLHFISFKMTAIQETQVNASILSKTLKEYSILYAMTFLRNSFSLTIICLKMLYLENFQPVFYLCELQRSTSLAGGRTQPAIIQYHAFNQGVKRS